MKKRMPHKIELEFYEGSEKAVQKFALKVRKAISDAAKWSRVEYSVQVTNTDWLKKSR